MPDQPAPHPEKNELMDTHCCHFLCTFFGRLECFGFTFVIPVTSRKRERTRMVPYSILISSYFFFFFFCMNGFPTLSSLRLLLNFYSGTWKSTRSTQYNTRPLCLHFANDTKKQIIFNVEKRKKKKRRDMIRVSSLGLDSVCPTHLHTHTHTSVFLVLLTPDIPLSTLMSVKQNTINLPCFYYYFFFSFMFFVHRTVFGFF